MSLEKQQFLFSNSCKYLKL